MFKIKLMYNKLVITRKLSRNYEKRSLNYEKISRNYDKRKDLGISTKKDDLLNNGGRRNQRSFGLC